MELAREGDGGKAYKLSPSALVEAIPTHLFFGRLIQQTTKNLNIAKSKRGNRAD